MNNFSHSFSHFEVNSAAQYASAGFNLVSKVGKIVNRKLSFFAKIITCSHASIEKPQVFMRKKISD